jgi:hypothetical protein
MSSPFRSPCLLGQRPWSEAANAATLPQPHFHTHTFTRAPLCYVQPTEFATIKPHTDALYHHAWGTLNYYTPLTPEISGSGTLQVRLRLCHSWVFRLSTVLLRLCCGCTHPTPHAMRSWNLSLVPEISRPLSSSMGRYSSAHTYQCSYKRLPWIASLLS